MAKAGLAAVAVSGGHPATGPAGLSVASRPAGRGVWVKLPPLLTATLAPLVSAMTPVATTTGTGTDRLVADWLTKSAVVRLPVPKRPPGSCP